MQMLLKLVLTGAILITLSVYNKVGLGVGDEAPDFQLKNVDGQMISLGSNKSAKGYIVIFTCNTCPYANMYEDRIIDLHNQYEPSGYPVLSIQPNDAINSPGDSFENMQKRSDEKSYPFPYLIDETQEITKDYGATNTPQVYVLKKVGDNNFRIEYIGAIDNNSRNGDAASKHYVEEAIDSLLSGVDIPNKTTKAIGCTIKWSD